ncbi:MAG: imm11 family protein [Endozoicomonas sp.]|uniref:imm11 family protein n=1 Tax=Endozoicomonas sp. TaxID=1892382 RepID=UPI003D9AE307
MTVNFADEDGKYFKEIPDISEHHGRLFLSEKAYDVLQDLLEAAGEFLPVKYASGNGYMFNPLQYAESVDGVDYQLSQKDEFNDVISLGFHENKVRKFMAFRSEFSYLNDLICQEELKERIEKNNLKGVLITQVLGNRSAAFNPELYLNS